MTATTWIGTPKALYRMARRGGDEWNRLKVSLPRDKREELDLLNERVETLSAELKDVKEAFEKEGSLRQERRLLREPWEEARRIALEPPESFDLALALVEVLHSEPDGKHRTKDLATKVHADVNHDDFLDALQMIVDAGYAEWTTSGKIRAVGVARLRASGMKFDSPDASLAKMCARLRALHVAPLWMLHENGSADSKPTEFQAVLNQMIPRLDGMRWAGPGIVADASVDLEFLDAEEIWPSTAQKRRGASEVELDLEQARENLKAALKSAAAELWAQREASRGAPMSSPPIDAGEGVPQPQFKPAAVPAFDPKAEPELDHFGPICPNCSGESRPGAVFCTHCGERFPTARNCASCGAEREPDGKFCPDCGAKYDDEPPSEVTELSDKRAKSEPESGPAASDEAVVIDNGRRRKGPLDEKSALSVKRL
jgi:Double zinc ribbon